MKQLLALILALVMCLSLTACGGDADKGGGSTAPESSNTPASNTTETTEPSTEPSTEPEEDKDETATPENYVVVDNDLLKIVVVGTGVYEYNSEWIGYNLLLTNKTDRSLHFYSYAEEYEENTGKNPYVDTCYLGGEKTGTHFSMVLNANATDAPAFLAIDGLSDPSEAKDVSGKFRVVYNDDVTEAALIGYFPYHFE